MPKNCRGCAAILPCETNVWRKGSDHRLGENSNCRVLRMLPTGSAEPRFFVNGEHGEAYVKIVGF
jgi:hypothetical protein